MICAFFNEFLHEAMTRDAESFAQGGSNQTDDSHDTKIDVIPKEVDMQMLEYWKTCYGTDTYEEFRDLVSVIKVLSENMNLMKNLWNEGKEITYLKNCISELRKNHDQAKCDHANAKQALVEKAADYSKSVARLMKSDTEPNVVGPPDFVPETNAIQKAQTYINEVKRKIDESEEKQRALLKAKNDYALYANNLRDRIGDVTRLLKNAPFCVPSASGSVHNPMHVEQPEDSAKRKLADLNKTATETLRSLQIARREEAEAIELEQKATDALTALRKQRVKASECARNAYERVIQCYEAIQNLDQRAEKRPKN